MGILHFNKCCGASGDIGRRMISSFCVAAITRCMRGRLNLPLLNFPQWGTIKDISILFYARYIILLSSGHLQRS